MAVCNSCGRFCPDDEGGRYCEVCRASYVAKLEEVEKAAQALASQSGWIFNFLQPYHYNTFVRLLDSLHDLELAHGKG